MQSIYNVLADIRDFGSNLYNLLVNFWNSLVNILSYIGSIFDSLWYGMTTLLSGTYDMLVQIFSHGLF